VLALADSWGSRFVDPSSLALGHPSNRSAIGTHAEERLVSLLATLGSDAFACAIPERTDPERLLALVD
jgi:hypothetical protein